MFKNLPSLKALRSFEAAARHRSISKAAKELSLTQGAVSYQVKRLESDVGVKLFHRRTRQIEITDAGFRIYQIIHRQFRELDDEILRIAPTGRASTLTVSVSTYFVTRWLSQRLGMFLNTNPHITIRLQHSVNDPDFTVDEVDLAIRWSDGFWPNCENELLIGFPMIVTCAPELLSKGKSAVLLEDVQNQTLLRDQEGIDLWTEWLELAGLPKQNLNTGPVIVDPNVRVQSAVDGRGLIMGNELMRQELEEGLLVEPFDIRLEGYGYYLIFNESGFTRRPVQVFVQWIKDQAKTYADELGKSHPDSGVRLG